MINRKPLFFILIALLIFLIGCSEAHVHTFSTGWKSNSEYHWHAATCEHTGEVSAKEKHSFEIIDVIKEATHTEDGEAEVMCTVCGYETNIILPASINNHTYSTDWTHDDNYHWHAATCEHADAISGKAQHSWNSGVVTKDATCIENGEKTYTCTVCGATKTESIKKLGHTTGVVCTRCGEISSSITLSEVGTTYKPIADGLDVTLNSLTVSEVEGGYYRYSINYTLANNVEGSEISPYIFKIIYSDGSYDANYGFFNDMYYGNTKTSSYSWQKTKSLEGILISCEDIFGGKKLNLYWRITIPTE